MHDGARSDGMYLLEIYDDSCDLECVWVCIHHNNVSYVHSRVCMYV